MITKKPDGKPQGRSRVSQASRLLSSAVGEPLPAPALDEPWRNKKGKGNQVGQKRKK